MKPDLSETNVEVERMLREKALESLALKRQKETLSTSTTNGYHQDLPMDIQNDSNSMQSQ